MVRIPAHREPTHPGEMLIEEFLHPMQITQRELADAIHVPYQRVNELVNQKRGVTPGTALRLGKFFGMSAGFWLNLQIRHDLYKARKSESTTLEKIHNFDPCQKSNLARTIRTDAQTATLRDLSGNRTAGR